MNESKQIMTLHELAKVPELYEQLYHRPVLVQSTLAEEHVLKKGDEKLFTSGYTKTSDFSHETITMLMAERATQVQELSQFVHPDSKAFIIAPDRKSLWSRVTIGRAPQNLIVLTDKTVSGKHAQFDVDHPTSPLVLTDLGSTNGTYLNRVQLQPHEATSVGNGDCIRFGQSIFYLLSQIFVSDLFRFWHN